MNSTPRFSGLQKSWCFAGSCRFSDRQACCRLQFVLPEEKSSISVTQRVTPTRTRCCSLREGMSPDSAGRPLRSHRWAAIKWMRCRGNAESGS